MREFFTRTTCSYRPISGAAVHSRQSSRRRHQRATDGVLPVTGYGRRASSRDHRVSCGLRAVLRAHLRRPARSAVRLVAAHGRGQFPARGRGGRGELGGATAADLVTDALVASWNVTFGRLQQQCVTWRPWMRCCTRVTATTRAGARSLRILRDTRQAPASLAEGTPVARPGVSRHLRALPGGQAGREPPGRHSAASAPSPGGTRRGRQWLGEAMPAASRLGALRTEIAGTKARR